MTEHQLVLGVVFIIMWIGMAFQTYQLFRNDKK